MRQRRKFTGRIPGKSKFFLTISGMLFPFTIIADLTLTPAELDLKNYSEPVKVLVMSDGRPVLPVEITKIVAGVFKTGNAVPEQARGGTHFSNYSYMFEFRTDVDGSITITPVKSLLQIGDYDLFVHTIYGTVSGVIDANLRDSIPARPPTKIKSSRFNYDFELPDYLFGQPVSIDLGPDKTRTYTWYIDGEIHSSGLGLTSFQARPEMGTHEISFIAKNADGEVVSTWSGTTRVSEEAPIIKTFRKGDKITFAAPGGYSRVTWIYNGKIISDTPLERSEYDSQEIAFKKKGAHTLVCHLQDSEKGHSRRITWSVNVK